MTNTKYLAEVMKAQSASPSGSFAVGGEFNPSDCSANGLFVYNGDQADKHIDKMLTITGIAVVGLVTIGLVKAFK